VTGAGATTAEVVASLGTTFAVFDRTQDSGHVSYGVVTADGRRLFVKTSGGPEDSPGGLSRAGRAEALRRTARLHGEVEHPTLVTLHEVVEARDGVVLVHEWFEGELLGCPRDRRDDPAEAHDRFKRLPAGEIATALDQVLSLHVALEQAGWIAGDFYDGCLMYDAGTRRIVVMDFESYRQGAYLNDRGRLPGSTRFMAPEELRLGATVDSRTTVFNLGRMLEIFLLARHDLPSVAAVVARATAERPEARPASVSDLWAAWRAARLEIRPATVDDGAELARIEVAAGRLFLSVDMPLVAGDEVDLAELGRAIADHRAWAASYDGEVAGYVEASVLDGRAHVNQVSVRPELGRRGIGHTLVRHVEAWGRERGLEGTTLTTFRDVPWNGPWYARLGYRELADSEIGPELRAVMEHEATWPGIVPDLRCAMYRGSTGAG
jgi:ribosomal protein S18 acetylase RimI-like enzyme